MYTHLKAIVSRDLPPRVELDAGEFTCLRRKKVFRNVSDVTRIILSFFLFFLKSMIHAREIGRPPIKKKKKRDREI